MAEIIINKAKQVSNSLTIQLNGSTVANFNGSGAAAVNITPSAIGAAITNHTHSWSSISGKPSTFAPSSHTHDNRYYTEAEVNNLLNSKLNTNKIISTSAVFDISGNYVDMAYSLIGATSGVNYFVMVQNANRAANDAVVIGVSILSQPSSSFRVYFDKSNVGRIQLNFIAIQVS